MNPRHLQPRRPRKDRDVTWSRSVHGADVTWTFWRRDHRRAIHRVDRTFSLDMFPRMNPNYLSATLRTMHRDLRDFVDEIDLAAMEQTA